MVFIQVSAVLAFTFVPHTRSGNLTQAINIISLDTQFFFNFMAHLLRPGFCTKSTDFQFEFFAGQTGVFDRISQIKCIRRSTTKHRWTEIMHQCDLFLRITAGHRNHGCSDIFCTGMCSQSTCKKSVSIRHLENIRTAGTISSKSTWDTFCPWRQVLTGISDNGRFSGSTGRRMNTHNLTHRHGTKSERIVIS